MVSDDEIGKSLRSLLTTPFQEAMEWGGPITSSALCYRSKPFRGLQDATGADRVANDSAGSS